MSYEWQGQPGSTIITIALSVCFGWLPIVILVSIWGKLRRRFGKPPVEDEENKTPRAHPKQPKLEIPNPIYHSTGGRLERTPSSTTNNRSSYSLRRWDSHASWDPIKPFEYNDNESTYGGIGGVARPNSMRSNFTAHSRMTAAPTPAGSISRASSVRSVASHRSHHEPPQSNLAHATPLPTQSRSRRASMSNNYDGPPVAFQINDTYYDTTPLPSTPKLHSSIREPSSSRPTSSRGSGSGSGSGATAQNHRGTSRERPSDAPRGRSSSQYGESSRSGREADSPRDQARSRSEGPSLASRNSSRSREAPRSDRDESSRSGRPSLSSRSSSRHRDPSRTPTENGSQRGESSNSQSPSGSTRDWSHHKSPPRAASATRDNNRDDSRRRPAQRQSFSEHESSAGHSALPGQASLHVQTFDPPEEDWFNQPHAM